MAPYLPAMAVLPPIASPRAAWRDLRAFFASRQRHQIVFALLAMAIPALFIVAFYHDAKPPLEGRSIIYVENFNGPRPDSVIKARQAIEKRERDRALAERRAAFQRLERKLGM